MLFVEVVELVEVVVGGCTGCRAPACSIFTLLCDKIVGHGGEHSKDGDRQFVPQAQGAAWRLIILQKKQCDFALRLS